MSTTFLPPQSGGRGWGYDIKMDDPPEHPLLQFARELAQKHGFTLEPSFESAFLRAIHAQQHDTTGVVDPQAEGMDNTAKLIFAAIALARIEARTTFDAEIFLGVLSLDAFCPLWPFCR